jgi:predicted DNA-binding protein
MRLTVEIPDEDHVYLKTLCTETKTTIKDFCSKAILKNLEQSEEQWWIENYGKEIKEFDPEKTISHEEFWKRVTS